MYPAILSFAIFFFLSFSRGQKSAEALRTVASSWRSLTPPGTESYLNVVYCMIRLRIVRAVWHPSHTKAPHLRRAAPTAYGAAEMVSPSNGRDGRSSSSNGNSDGDSTSPAAILPCLDAEATLARDGRWLRFLRRK